LGRSGRNNDLGRARKGTKSEMRAARAGKVKMPDPGGVDIRNKQRSKGERKLNRRLP